MPIDPRIPLGYEPAPYIDPRQLREQHIEEEARRRQAQVQEMHLREQERKLSEQQEWRKALGRGAKSEELMRISPSLTSDYHKAVADEQKAQREEQSEQLKQARERASRLASIAGSVHNEFTLHLAVKQALQERLITREQADYVTQLGWTPETQQWLQAYQNQAMSIADRATAARDAFDRDMRTAGDSRAQAAEQRAAQQFPVEQLRRGADALLSQMNAAGQAVGAVQSQEQYDAWRATLPVEIQRRVPLMYSPGAVEIVQRMAMTPAEVLRLNELNRHNQKIENLKGISNAIAQTNVNRTAATTRQVEEGKLRDDFNKGVRSFITVRDAFGRIMQAAKQQTPASDIALIYGYMRMLDPTSTVREGEYATARDAGGIPDRVLAWYNKAVEGQQLAPDIRKDFIKQSNLIYQQAELDYLRLYEFYKNQAARFGMRPEEVLPDYRINQKESPDRGQAKPTQPRPDVDPYVQLGFVEEKK